jgi:hypothetical protein
MNKYYFDLNRKKDNEIECSICGEDIIHSNDLFKCCNTLCFSPICTQCSIMLIEYSSHNKNMPTCPNPTCKHHFLRDMFKKRLDTKYLTLYDESCFTYMMTDKEDDANTRITHITMIERIRKERLTFLQNNFPASIAFVVQVTFGAKLRRIEQKNKMALAGITKYNKKCMNITCNGVLDRTGECMRCRTQYCMKCERTIHGNMSTHICKEDDLASVQLMDSILRCPTCNVPAVKVSGCSSLTCSNCRTLFTVDGKIGGHGGGYDPVNMKNEDAAQKLTTEYSGYLDGKSQLQLYLAMIESLLPPTKTQEVFINVIQKYIDNPIAYPKEQVAIYISKKYNNYMNNVVFNKEYHKCLVELETRLRSGNLTNTIAKKVYDYIQILNKYFN